MTIEGSRSTAGRDRYRQIGNNEDAIREARAMTSAQPKQKDRPVTESTCNIPLPSGLIHKFGSHHWVIPEPNGPTSQGACKQCSEKKLLETGKQNWILLLTLENLPRISLFSS